MTVNTKCEVKLSDKGSSAELLNQAGIEVYVKDFELRLI